ncbi:restriction endonuclease subunit S [Sedimentibacter sp. B4]|uniref:restriction endonuclease subunit S n=1 Tax=Sedimentibacter sp. B4 TaxID=304766 RepID=UPI001E527BDE|nr:restriction endonuclease subunit S [Sedimentibacter sp. B4]
MMEVRKLSNLEQLINELCPDGVEFVPMWEVTIWDKRFNSVDRKKQPQIITYPYLLAADLFKLEQSSGDVFLLSTGEQTGWTTEELAADYLCYGEVVTIPWGKSRPVKEVLKYYKGKFVTADNRIATSNDTTKLLNKYLYYWMLNNGETIDRYYRGSGIKHPNMNDVLNMTIPLPPLPVQEEIVRILDNFMEHTVELAAELKAELKARKKQYEYYRDNLLTFGDEVEVKPLEKICINCDRQRKPVTKSARQAGEYPYYGASGIVDYVSDYIFDGDYLLVSEDGANLIARSTPIAFSISGKNWVNNHAHVLKFDTYEMRKFVEIYLNAIDLSRNISTAAQPKLTQDNLNKIPIPVPDFDRVKYIVDILDRFDKLCNGIREGLPAEIKAREQQYEYYRDKLLTFKEKEVCENE